VVYGNVEMPERGEEYGERSGGERSIWVRDENTKENIPIEFQRAYLPVMKP
jgi:hypothetical protein